MTSTAQNKLVQLRQLVRRSRARLKRLEQERARLDKSLKEVDEGLEAIAHTGVSDLVRAVEDGDLAAVRALLKAGADPNGHNREGEPVLLLAAYQERGLPIVRELLKAGADVDGTDHQQNTPLIVSVRDENLSLVKELVRRGADVNAKNVEGDTPLTNAACWGSERTVRFLLAHSADPNLPDGMNISPAQLARQQDHPTIAALIERHQKSTRS